LGVDVEERTGWGIDMCTAVNILFLLPKNVPGKLLSEFIEKKMVFAI
jgi:hypothetical protein